MPWLTCASACPIIYSLRRSGPVLDLDETLVHCSTLAVENADRMFQVTLNSQVFDVRVDRRELRGLRTE